VFESGSDYLDENLSYFGSLFMDSGSASECVDGLVGVFELGEMCGEDMGGGKDLFDFGQQVEKLSSYVSGVSGELGVGCGNTFTWSSEVYEATKRQMECLIAKSVHEACGWSTAVDGVDHIASVGEAFCRIDKHLEDMRMGPFVAGRKVGGKVGRKAGGKVGRKAGGKVELLGLVETAAEVVEEADRNETREEDVCGEFGDMGSELYLDGMVELSKAVEPKRKGPVLATPPVFKKYRADALAMAMTATATTTLDEPPIFSLSLPALPVSSAATYGSMSREDNIDEQDEVMGKVNTVVNRVVKPSRRSIKTMDPSALVRCEYCSSVFTQRTNYYSHRSTVHGDVHKAAKAAKALAKVSGKAGSC